MPKKFTLLCHFNYYGRIWVILLEFKLACRYMSLSFHPCGMIVSPMWNDRITSVERSYHPGETIKM